MTYSELVEVARQAKERSEILDRLKTVEAQLDSINKVLEAITQAPQDRLGSCNADE